MIFPPRDQILLTQELGRYGITYSDEHDSLVVAPELKGHADLVADAGYLTSPSGIVSIVCVGEDYVGAIFCPVTELIFRFWNAELPAEIPTDYIADIMDLCMSDMQFCHLYPDIATFQQAVTIHRIARLFVQKTEFLPPFVMERIKANLQTFPKDTVH